MVVFGTKNQTTKKQQKKKRNETKRGVRMRRMDSDEIKTQHEYFWKNNNVDEWSVFQ